MKRKAELVRPGTPKRLPRSRSQLIRTKKRQPEQSSHFPYIRPGTPKKLPCSRSQVIKTKKRQSALVNYQDEEFPMSDDDYAISPSPIPCTPSYASSTSSSSSEFLEVICNICMEDKTFEMFPNSGSCGHLFCSDCISKHIDAKIKENITIVTCPEPNCKILIEPEVCRHLSLVPKEVLDRWDNALCKSLIKGSEKFYCAFKDCSALLVDDGGEAVTSSECPHCNRLFCAQCKVPWHAGMDCNEHQSLIKKGEIAGNDNMLMDLAKNKKWKRCSNCNFYVEKTTGCEHIACRCGYHFCYKCGNKWNGGGHLLLHCLVSICASI